MAARFKDILGPDSVEWNQVRQAAFRDLVKTTKFNGDDLISGQQSLASLDKAMKQNKSLMTEIFTPNEIGKIRRFFTLAKRSQPDLRRSRMNPSGSGVTKLLGEMGFLGIDVSTLGAGTRVWEAVSRSIIAPRQAGQAVRPFNQIVSDLKILSGTTTSGARTATQDQDQQLPQ